MAIPGKICLNTQNWSFRFRWYLAKIVDIYHTVQSGSKDNKSQFGQVSKASIQESLCENFLQKVSWGLKHEARELILLLSTPTQLSWQTSLIHKLFEIAKSETEWVLAERPLGIRWWTHNLAIKLPRKLVGDHMCYYNGHRAFLTTTSVVRSDKPLC